MLIMPVSLYLDIILLILLRIYFKDIKFDSIEQISKYILYLNLILSVSRQIIKNILSENILLSFSALYVNPFYP